jgi:hypothetical protein
MCKSNPSTSPTKNKGSAGFFVFSFWILLGDGMAQQKMNSGNLSPIIGWFVIAGLY